MMRLKQLVLAAALLSVVACSTTPSADDAPAGAPAASGSEFSEFDAAGGGGDAAAASPEAGVENDIAGKGKAAEAPKDDFSEFGEKPAEGAQQPPAAGDEFSDFEKPADQAIAKEPPATPPAVDSGFEPLPPDAPPPEAAATEPVPPPAVADAPPPEVTPVAPAPEAPETSAAPEAGAMVNITDIQYRANDNGGTVVIEADGPMSFHQRMNAATRQFIVEVPNSKLPRKLKRPLNTRDFAGTIGSIDAYQGKGSTTTRIVVQLRSGAPEPAVQTEGNNLFVVAEPPGGGAGAGAEAAAEEGAAAEPLNSKLLSSSSIEEFLASNQSFYGKKISIETDDAELRDIFRLISEESSVNLIISDEVKGKLSLKLKNVPWDQALVMIMKAKKLGYTRAGNVLRIAPLADIRTEEEDAIKLVTAKKANEPLKIKTIQVNYAKVDDLEKQVKSLLTTKGTAIADTRTSSLIVTDQEENVDRAEKLVRALDVPPQQVLIEGKVVEATENFERDVGINWNTSGKTSSVGSNLRSTTSINSQPSLGSNSSFGLKFSLGTMDVLGDLTASLNLFEQQSLVKVISSPRVVTLHNEPAEIAQTTELPLITANIAANGTATPVVNFKPVKLRLQVTPQITNDGAVILGVDVSREVAGAVVDQKTQAFPVNSRSAKTKVIVKNGQTAVIGGIYQNDQTEGNTKVPWIADVPIVGWLFKTQTTKKDRTELLIFITPRILGQLEGAPSSMSSSPTSGGDLAPVSDSAPAPESGDFGGEF